MLNVPRHFRNAVQPLIQTALGLDLSARAAWWRELRADCPSVARELEQLMATVPEFTRSTDIVNRTRESEPGSLEYLGLRC